MNATAGKYLAWHEQAIVGALRALPTGIAGKARLGRLVCKSFLHRRDVELTTWGGCRLLVPTLLEPISFYTLIDGIYEPDLVEVLKRVLHPGGAFIDIGANVGIFSLVVSRLVGDAGRVVAIEASPSVLPYLQNNVATNAAGKIQIVSSAAGSAGPAMRPFWEAPANHFGMGSLAAQFHDHPIDVPVDTLDHILDTAEVGVVDLVKIDIEGFEAAAFEGAQRLLDGDARPPIVFEFAAWAETRAGFAAGTAQAHLLAMDYQLFTI